MASTTDRVLELVALRQARRRAFNERLSRLDVALDPDAALLFRCECGLIGCAATIKLRAEDYAALRAEPRQLAVHVDHVIHEAEDVVETRRSHAIVRTRLPASGSGLSDSATRAHPRPARRVR
jgi:hypothetical protein